MLKREEIVRELWRRMTTVEGVEYTSRNPDVAPSIDNLPLVNIFELDDRVEKHDMRGGVPVYFRVLQVVFETFIKGTSAGDSSAELFTFLAKVKTKLYEGGPTLGGLCTVLEVEQSRVLQPEIGSYVVGIGTVLELRYIEDVKLLTT